MPANNGVGETGLQAVEEAATESRVCPVETLLHEVPLGLCVTAMAVMIHDTLTNEYETVCYSDLDGFKYLVYMNELCAAYSLVSMLYTAVPRLVTLSCSWFIFLLDQVLH